MPPLHHHKRPMATAPVPYVESDDDSIFDVSSYTSDENLYGEDMSIQSDETRYGEAAHTPTSSNDTQPPKIASEARVGVSGQSLERIMEVIQRCLTYRSAFAPGSSTFGYYTRCLHKLQEEYHQASKHKKEGQSSSDNDRPDEVKSLDGRTLVDQPLSSCGSNNAPKKKWNTIKMVSDWASSPRGFYEDQTVTYTVSADTKKSRKLDGAPKSALTLSGKQEKAALELRKPPPAFMELLGNPIKPSKLTKQSPTTEGCDYTQDKDVKKGKQRDSLPAKSSKQSPPVETKTSRSSRSRNPLPQSTTSTLEHPRQPIAESDGLYPPNTTPWYDFEDYVCDGYMQFSPRFRDYRPKTRDVSARSLRANSNRTQEQDSRLRSDQYSDLETTCTSATKPDHIGDGPAVLGMTEPDSAFTGSPLPNQSTSITKAPKGPSTLVQDIALPPFSGQDVTADVLSGEDSVVEQTTVEDERVVSAVGSGWGGSLPEKHESAEDSPQRDDDMALSKAQEFRYSASHGFTIEEALSILRSYDGSLEAAIRQFRYARSHGQVDSWLASCQADGNETSTQCQDDDNPASVKGASSKDGGKLRSFLPTSRLDNDAKKPDGSECCSNGEDSAHETCPSPNAWCSPKSPKIWPRDWYALSRGYDGCPSSKFTVIQTDWPKPANYTVTYWATIEHGEQTVHIPIDSSNVSGSEKAIIEGTAGMKKVWKWVQEKGLDSKVSLQDAFELAKDMHGETKAREVGTDPWSAGLGFSGWSG